MALQIERQSIETQERVGEGFDQVLVRVEALVPGAGREAIEPLLADAELFIQNVDLQTDRLVIEGSVECQAAYRQGEETSLRALSGQTTLNHVMEIPDARAGMLGRVQGEVTHVDARYENGHMVFQVSCDLRGRVSRLEKREVITEVGGAEGLQTNYAEIESFRLAAESSEMALLTQEVSLPAALDARTALMDRTAVEIDSAEADLGGVRVKGRLLAETLVASGVEGRPAVLVRYPMPFDQLVELPEWLSGSVIPEAAVRSVKSRVESGEGGELRLVCEAGVRVGVLANTSDKTRALTDAYATRGSEVKVENEEMELCAGVADMRISQTIRGTLLIGENAPGVGTVIAALARPVVGQWREENGAGRVEGVMEVCVLYMPGGSDAPAATQAELPFEVAVPQALNEGSVVRVQTLSAEVNALMSDRLELKAQVCVSCETRRSAVVRIVGEMEEGGPVSRRPGIAICWPEGEDTRWSLGRRYAIPAESVPELTPGKPVVLGI